MGNVSDKTENYFKEVLQNKFDEEKFKEFIKDLLNLENSDIKEGKKQSATTEQYKKYIDYVQFYAKYTDLKKNNIGVLIIKIKDNKNPAKARTLQRNYIAHLLEDYDLDASLSAIYSETDDIWRLSLVKKEITVSVGKINKKLSPAKRYSYLFGKNEPNHTAKNQLKDFIENNERKYSLGEIEEKFSVESVNTEFFENYKNKYLELKEQLEANEDFISESLRCGFTSEEFTKKLMGQLVFLYFLQKKGWLGVHLVPKEMSFNEYNAIYSKQDLISQKVLEQYYTNFEGKKKIKSNLIEQVKENETQLETLSDIFVGNEIYDKPWGTGNKKFVRNIFEKAINNKRNFFDDYLEPFFYNGLNYKRKNQYFGVFNCKIPFLNGGLFEPLDNYNWAVAKFKIPNEIFSNTEGTGILDLFDRYNFTIDEEEPLEKDVAVDPEMLGNIFEKLLDVKDRKSKGTYYTPREIVHYMCQESLANFLVNKVDVKYDEIKEFIQYGEMITDLDFKEATEKEHILGDSVFEKIQEIDKALENIKIADPAVGSGAFPLGMLNEIVKLRDCITSYMLIYNRLGKFGKQYKESEIQKGRSIYELKWNTIKNCIYAVDIENSAIDITKLRLWLSIVVDQVEVPAEGPQPLPNLDCKIMQGNSLIDEYNGIKLIDEEFIKELKAEDDVKLNNGDSYTAKSRNGRNVKVEVDSNQIHFGEYQKKAQIDGLINLKQELYETNEANRKKELLEKIQSARKELLRLNFQGTSCEQELFEIDKSHNKPYFSWKLEFIEVFIESDGFDIVIGNPPYLESRNPEFDSTFKEELQKIIKKRYGKNSNYFPKGTDLLIYFFELSIRLLRNNGINTFITQNAWLDTEYGRKFQKFLLNNVNVLAIIDSNYKYFQTADINTVITLFQKTNDITSPITYFKVLSKTFNNCNIHTQLEIPNIERKIIDLDNELVNKIKWGFLFNASKELIDVLNKMYILGENSECSNISIGQGQNLTKEYFIKERKGLYNENVLIPIFVVENNGSLIWNKPTSYIIDKNKNTLHFDNVKEFDISKTTKIPPQIILPRGIGNKHFATINRIGGYSSSYVDIYTDDDKEKIQDIWLFCNSSIFWLIRETAGRTNLGGGMLKAEAIDLKNIPIYYKFNREKEINQIIEKVNFYVVEDALKEIEKDYHKQIDKIVFDFLEIDELTQKKLLEELKLKIENRTKKALT